MFDKSVVLLRLAKLDEYVSRLKRFEPVGLQEYLGNQDMQAVVERYLQLSIQVCIDIANYIIARKRLSFPFEQENIFLLLGKAGIIPNDLANRIKGIVSFRNILVHDYMEINPEKVYGILKHSFNDFDEFARASVYFIEKQEGE
ncbi:hypothetical protein Psch_01797 [Pelotomaculum schinkii]|uniref:DUF86 domain-containing protein n=1 Tax=Pelotomaculum schinkii TaxID=78350 RepID=A0A4Y7RHS4_9FIRM|nr:DUF86 domain-containing protein [Pelotomaculum schinkii]TEB08242.1 hypothetical protein Psch_01797 [Pelotomaculum schinkii]